MANSGPHTNGCQFFITTAPADFLDGKHVCFGQILDDPENMLILRKVENVPTGANNRPKLAVRVIGKCDRQLKRSVMLASDGSHAQNAVKCKRRNGNAFRVTRHSRRQDILYGGGRVVVSM